ncbi:transmembrane protein, putative, partial [Bodo saltans]
ATNFETLEPQPTRITLAETGIVQLGGAFIVRGDGEGGADQTNVELKLNEGAQQRRDGDVDDDPNALGLLSAKFVNAYVLALAIIAAGTTIAVVFRRKRRVARGMHS